VSAAACHPQAAPEHISILLVALLQLFVLHVAAVRQQVCNIPVFVQHSIVRCRYAMLNDRYQRAYTISAPQDALFAASGSGVLQQDAAVLVSLLDFSADFSAGFSATHAITPCPSQHIHTHAVAGCHTAR
jgi:hypothetical protein